MRAMPKPKKLFVHLLVHDPKGPIPAATTNLRVACEPGSLMPESASTVAMPTVITCPRCLASADYLELAEEMDATSSADRAAAQHVADLETAKSADSADDSEQIAEPESSAA